MRDMMSMVQEDAGVCDMQYLWKRKKNELTRQIMANQVANLGKGYMKIFVPFF